MCKVWDSTFVTRGRFSFFFGGERGFVEFARSEQISTLNQSPSVYSFSNFALCDQGLFAITVELCNKVLLNLLK